MSNKSAKAKPCENSLTVKVGMSVRFYLPLAGCTDKLITAEVTKVHAGKRGQAPRVDIAYETQAGAQTREGIAYVGAEFDAISRMNKWQDFPISTAKKAKQQAEASAAAAAADEAKKLEDEEKAKEEADKKAAAEKAAAAKKAKDDAKKGDGKKD